MTGICNGEECLVKNSCQHFVCSIRLEEGKYIEPCFDVVEGSCCNYYASSENIKVVDGNKFIIDARSSITLSLECGLDLGCNLQTW